MSIPPIGLPGCQIDAMEVDSDQLTVVAKTTGMAARCPKCRTKSSSVHSYYVRKVKDLPVSEFQVCLHLTVRRFRCQHTQCPQKTFTEQLPNLLNRYARRTQRLTESYYECVQALGGEAGARLLQKMRMPTSGDTLLRVAKQHPQMAYHPPRVIGVDDWAFRKGYNYGTIIVDLERHVVIDLLPDRTSMTLAAWLDRHRTVEIVARDRSTEYARGIREGAPSALQVADRWHLLQNLVQALERQFNQLRSQLLELSSAPPLSYVQANDAIPRKGGNERILQEDS